MNDEIDETNNRRQSLARDVFTFLIGPLVFLLLVRFTGYGIFYGSNPTKEEKRKVVFRLSSGAFFYLLILVLLAAAA